jgi:hypothetical protein
LPPDSNTIASAKPGAVQALQRAASAQRFEISLAEGIQALGSSINGELVSGLVGASPSNWLFAGPLRSGKRAAAIMSLIRSARMNGHDPYAYLKDVLTRLPMQRASEIGQLLPHQWVPA